MTYYDPDKRDIAAMKRKYCLSSEELKEAFEDMNHNATLSAKYFEFIRASNGEQVLVLKEPYMSWYDEVKDLYG